LLWTVSTSLPQSQPSFILLSMQDKIEGFRIWAFPAHHLWHYFFHFWSLVQNFRYGQTVGPSLATSEGLDQISKMEVMPKMTCQRLKCEIIQKVS